MRKFKSLRFLMLIALLAIAISPVAAQDDETTVTIAADDPIIIVVATDLTGPIAEFGLDIAQAVEVAVAEINDAGGIDGHQVELITEDDRCSGDEATTVANRVVSNPQVVAVVGHICSGATIAASDVYEEARIPMMSPSATAAGVTERGLDVMNRVAFRDDVQGVVDANYMYKVLGLTKIAVMHDNDSYGLGLAEVVRDTFTELGGEVVGFEGISVDDQDYRSVLTTLVPDAPEAIFFGGYVQQAVLLVPQMQDVGLGDVIFFSDDGVYGEAFIDGAGDAAEGGYASFAQTPETDPERLEAFDATYEDMFGVAPADLGPFHYHAYDSAKMILGAIESVAEAQDDGSLVIDRNALVEAVRGTADYDGLTGMLTCDEKGDCGAGSIAINLVEDGAWVAVELPADLVAPAATAEAAQ
ncbi:branched-chain amino acid ABC transporter substrate-binding protein [Aggregatilinea lenta]|uniref:branched-chain amino acid ABC transporter substrate-binding protein n=1 Tax=Aggregatilinea lenta TaxID=913108 RepID=UPI000E5AE3CC|nr:branched-chain amino acid ABC transporter substrate-binding protein [Aggregatilinea lenta]